MEVFCFSFVYIQLKYRISLRGIDRAVYVTTRYSGRRFNVHAGLLRKWNYIFMVVKEITSEDLPANQSAAIFVGAAGFNRPEAPRRKAGSWVLDPAANEIVYMNQADGRIAFLSYKPRRRTSPWRPRIVPRR
jgi:hypothetical protein